MSKGKGVKHLKPADFNQIKLLQKAGLSNSKISKLLNRGHSTVCMIAKVSTFKEYKDYSQRKRAEYRHSSPEDVEIEVVEESVGPAEKGRLIADAIGMLQRALEL